LRVDSSENRGQPLYDLASLPGNTMPPRFAIPLRVRHVPRQASRAMELWSLDLRYAKTTSCDRLPQALAST